MFQCIREIVPDTQVAVVNGRIAYVGSDASHTIGSKTKTIHLGGKYLVPGFADPHTHIDQFVMPQYLAEKSLLHGTTTLFADSIEKVTKKVTRILTCPECKKKFNTYGIRIKKFELVAA